MDQIQKEAIAKAWSKEKSPISRIRFWESAHILRYINELVCGKALDGWNKGALDLLPTYYKNATGKNMPVFKKALSVGGGAGWKEMFLLENNFVDIFYVFEFSTVFTKKAKLEAEKKGLTHRLIYSDADFFTSDLCKENSFDMVFWDNSLHHMFDVKKALEISRTILKPEGLLFCNDFAGKSRFQWSDAELSVVNSVRKQLYQMEPKLFQIPFTSAQFPVFIQRPSLQSMIESDPSEAADSENILPALNEIFPDIFIKQSGGLIYHLCLSDILTNIPENSKLLDRMLQLDKECIDKGFIHYFFAFAVKKEKI